MKPGEEGAAGRRSARRSSGGLRRRLVAGGGVAAVALAFGLASVPIFAQRAPTSLLPPGFGDTAGAEGRAESKAPKAAKPAEAPATPEKPAQQGEAAPAVAADEGATPVAAPAPVEDEISPEELARQQRASDLPKNAHRSLDRIGPLTAEDGGLPADAFGASSGRYLAAMMRATRAPVVSRWASILLRRALLSATDTPHDVEGADWAAERAWLLVRMGEADPARMMVQSVDSDRYSPRLYAVAMQAYLASADPTGLCPLYQGAEEKSGSAGWRMAEAICASFSAEQGKASAILGQAQRFGSVRGIDLKLTEKMVGAGTNSRRSVKVDWDGVGRLTAWRFGLATALNVDIPAPLIQQAGMHVLAWQARAPALALEKRQAAVEAAARLGVFSGAALIDYYSQLADDENAPESFDVFAGSLRQAYGGTSVGDRIDGMRDLWGTGARDLVRLLALSRAAAMLPVADVDGSDVSNLVASMMSAGYDDSALRWASAGEALAADDGVDGWAMLAVGAPRMVVSVPVGRLRDYIAADGVRGEMMLAGLAGLGRIGDEDFAALAGDAHLVLTARSRWERAIDEASVRGEPGTVALLAAVGMQVNDWRRLPPEHLYHIVAALHRVGLDPEARMIAAEAIMRS